MRTICKVLTLGMLFMNTYAFSVSSDFIKTDDRERSATELYTRLNPGKTFYLSSSDKEFSEIAKKYIYSDIASQSTLSPHDRELVTVTTLVTLQMPEHMLTNSFEEALNAGVPPVELREGIYQLSPYIGIARTIVALEILNKVFEKKNICISDSEENLATTSDQDRFEQGLKFQTDTYGDRITKMRETTPAYQKHLQDDLSAFCFGDIYTRKGLDLKHREFLTVAAIGTLGIEAQFKSHVIGTLAAGGSKEEVIGIITAMNPYIGFPRTLNLLKYANEIFADK